NETDPPAQVGRALGSEQVAPTRAIFVARADELDGRDESPASLGAQDLDSTTRRKHGRQKQGRGRRSPYRAGHRGRAATPVRGPGGGWLPQSRDIDLHSRPGVDLLQGNIARRQDVVIESIRDRAGPGRMERFPGAALAQRGMKMVQ